MGPGASNMGPGASKMGPGASKMAPSWCKIDQDCGLEILRHPKRVKQTPGSGLGGPRAAKMGANGPQGLPKASQNGAKMGSKSAPKGDQIWSAQKYLRLIDF